jgi:hypothetical protein
MKTPWRDGKLAESIALPWTRSETEQLMQAV